MSPLLANLLLDDLDKELERRGHRFCRGACPRAGRRPDPWADDSNIYVRSQAAGERVMASVTSFLENRLRLKVNRQKSAVAPVGERQFLGHRLGRGGKLGIGRKSLARAKDRLREITRRNRGDCSLERVIEQVNRFVTGWVTYYRHARCKSTLRDLDGWLRRKLRCVKLKRCKHVRTMVRFLIGNGATRGDALKQEVGLGHYEGRGWRGLHHHVTLCIAAYGFLAAERAAFPPSGPANQGQPTTLDVSLSSRSNGAPVAFRAAYPGLDRDTQAATDGRTRRISTAVPLLRRRTGNRGAADCLTQ